MSGSPSGSLSLASTPAAGTSRTRPSPTMYLSSAATGAWLGGSEKTPATGSQSLSPKGNCSSALPCALRYRRKNVVSEGRNTPTVSVPSPVQSPAMSRSPGSP